MPETPPLPSPLPAGSVLPIRLVGTRVRFLQGAGETLAAATPLESVTRYGVVFNQIDHPGRVHVYCADCAAGTRLRVQLLTPAPAAGRTPAPAVALVAQGAPGTIGTGAGGLKPPVTIPAGYSAQAQGPAKLPSSAQTDAWTGVSFYPGPTIDTRTLVGGRVYVVVWSPDNLMGKYALQIGHVPVHEWRRWLPAPWVWWRVRGWFGLPRTEAYLVLALVLAAALLVALVVLQSRNRRGRRRRAAVECEADVEQR